MNALSSLLQPARGVRESRSAYVKRRATGNRLVDSMLRGRIARHESSRALQLPPAGEDVAIDHAIIRQQIRDVTVVVPPVIPPPFGPSGAAAPKGFRVGRTKGVTYRRPVPKAPSKRDEWRSRALQEHR